MSGGHWAFWLGGLGLAGVSIAHWLLLHRMFAVSGRFTALVDRVRFGAQEAPSLSDREMIEALRALTEQELGPDAVAGEAREPLKPLSKGPQPPAVQLAFLASLALGGVLSAFLRGDLHPVLGLNSEILPRVIGSSPWATPVTMLLGGFLVGFGTRMAGGCTSGHGLCGVSRFQPGSLVATAAFFGMGAAFSFLLASLT